MKNRRAAAHLVPLLSIALTSFAANSPAPAAAGPGQPGGKPGAHLGPYVSRLARGYGAGLDQTGRRLPLGREELEFYARFLPLNTEVDPPTIRVWMKADERGRTGVEAQGVRIQGRAGSLVSAIVPLPRLAALAAQPGVEWVRAPHRVRTELDLSRPDVIDLPGPDISTIWGLGGRDILVGVVDTGVDWGHLDFRKPDGSTRILMYWDQTDDCGSPPPGYTYGCLWTESHINDALGAGPPIGADDTGGHGSHVAGIMAGNGLGTGNGEPAETYVGIAREAAFIVVDIFPDSGVSCSDCDAGDALAFIDQQASVLGMPVSVNFSFGNQFYDHEDTDPWGQVIDAVTGPGIQGRVVTKSAGNSGGAPIHDTGTVSTGTTSTHLFELPSYTPAPGTFNDLHIFNIWYPAGDLLTVEVTSPRGRSHSASTGDGFTGVGTNDGVIIIDDSDSPMPNGKQFFTVELDDQLGTAPRSGTWTLRITGDSVGSSGEYHMWTWYSGLGTSGLSGWWSLPDPTTLISEPGNSAHVITVGAYVTKTEWENILGSITGYTPAPTIGDLVDFSSPGPTADGRLRPHVAAPGMGIASSLSSTVSGSVDPLRVVKDGVHWVIEGTSMSSPHVAGCAALLLEANPCLDATAIRSILAETARVDSHVTTPPNNDWGYGKLDIAAAADRVVMHVADLTAQPDAQTFTWTPHAAADSHNVHRGLLSALDGVNYGAVIQPGVAVPSFVDATLPPAGDGFFYSIQTVDSSGVEGVKGFSFACEPGEHVACAGFEAGHMLPWGRSCP